MILEDVAEIGRELHFIGKEDISDLVDISLFVNNQEIKIKELILDITVCYYEEHNKIIITMIHIDDITVDTIIRELQKKTTDEIIDYELIDYDVTDYIYSQLFAALEKYFLESYDEVEFKL